jgi:signal transduction histidine kinase
VSPRSDAHDYNLRILWSLARYVEERFGAEALQRVSAAGGVTPSAFEGKSFWVSAEAFEAILAAARARMADEDEFKRASVHRMKEAYGPLRHVLWATSPGAVYSQGVKHIDLVCDCGSLTMVSRTETSAHVRVTSRVPYSRLNCLVRQAQTVLLPTLWGLPPAHLREEACLGLGDSTCELHVRWFVHARRLPLFAGALAAALLGWVLLRLGVPGIPTPIAMALAGGLLGHVLEGRRSERMNETTRREVIEAFRILAHEENEARREVLEMHRRQKGWTRLVEEEMGTRAQALQRLADGVKELHQAHATKLLGVSHDLRSPLAIIQANADFLRTAPAVLADPEAAQTAQDIYESATRMRRLLGDLVDMTRAQRDFVTMAPQPVDTGDLLSALERRLRALLYGRDVRRTVLATRDAPEYVEVDPLALDRIVDNLVTNAAKYTERGAVVVELDGALGQLVIRVSDTGRGIEPDVIERIFQPGGSSPESRRGDSFGVGMSVVVQLLEQMGGRMEVMSRPGAGTTFWVYLPLRAKRGSSARASTSVVTIRGRPSETPPPVR